jgi:NADPH2 dehydrogenase
MTVTTPKLFTPAKVGDVTLQHHIVMAPLTRFRATKEHVPTDLMVEYYAQRASTPGTLIISEATFIAPQAGGYAHVPGIWNDEQIAAWKRVSSSSHVLIKALPVSLTVLRGFCGFLLQVTDAVHAQGSFIYCQLWALGRAAETEVLEAEGPYPYVSASDVKLAQANAAPRPLTIQGKHP